MSLNADGMGSGPPYLSDSPAIAKKKVTHRGKRGRQKLNKNKQKDEEEVGHNIDATERLDISPKNNAPAPAIEDSQKQPTVVHLTSPMTIAAGSELHITCNSAIKLDVDGREILISATAPILITAPTEPVQLKIEPSEFCLGPDFVRGWQKLSDELKLHILRFNLVVDVPVGIYDDDLIDRLRMHLAMGGDIAALSRELFYKENRFKLHLMTWLSLPHPSARPLIRNIELDTILHGTFWKALQKFARDVKDIYSFESLTTFKIRFSWYPGCMEEFSAMLESDLRSEMAVVFPSTCKLQVAFDKSVVASEFEEHRTIYERLEQDLKQMIVCG
jgi:hypothetical protein